ncbi:MAG TPA: FCD domain-containing protein [Solirubrobacteraceae bacterium]|nr:FCD domain-containing protein [Solirubrobacteraceae bacterium]
MVATKPHPASDRDAFLDAAELCELVPAEAILESLVVREAPRFDTAVIERLRAASARLRCAAGDPAVAARAEHEFHRELVDRCRDERLRRSALGVQRALLPYRLAAPVGAVHHEAIVDALADGDHTAAAERIRAAFASTLARLLAGVERRRGA